METLSFTYQGQGEKEAKPVERAWVEKHIKDKWPDAFDEAWAYMLEQGGVALKFGHVKVIGSD